MDMFMARALNVLQVTNFDNRFFSNRCHCYFQSIIVSHFGDAFFFIKKCFHIYIVSVFVNVIGQLMWCNDTFDKKIYFIRVA